LDHREGSEGGVAEEGRESEEAEPEEGVLEKGAEGMGEGETAKDGDDNYAKSEEDETHY
jgi:hypothetical protein